MLHIYELHKVFYISLQHDFSIIIIIIFVMFFFLQITQLGIHFILHTTYLCELNILKFTSYFLSSVDVFYQYENISVLIK